MIITLVQIRQARFANQLELYRAVAESSRVNTCTLKMQVMKMYFITFYSLLKIQLKPSYISLQQLITAAAMRLSHCGGDAVLMDIVGFYSSLRANLQNTNLKRQRYNINTTTDPERMKEQYMKVK